MPKLKLKVESALQKYLTEELTDEGFKESIQAVLDAFEGKNLLHQNIGQLTWQHEKLNPGEQGKFTKIWILLEETSPRITQDFNSWLEKKQLHQGRGR